MTANRTLALVFVVASIVFLTVMVPELNQQQASMGGGFYSVGPSALPTFAGAMVLLFGVVMLFTDRPVPGEAGAFTAGIGMGLLQIGLFGAYALGLSTIGFLPASILFLAAIFLIYRAKNWLVAASLALGLPILVDALLRKIFLVPLPGASFF
ncbi:tripartite tricarboxylate transporter TctB family protein [Hoeflea sp. YIM 152468]|uniref:tripartite tricarboxylate transporter TctB family protein n=1 Tax=Hoeflea sp. YIM 152468 TaxID=3031759 RepID=UPI0023DAEDE1|nr:tripartite tricarboxylate transporter TctB family protein [Hoeflea sp. YIM 152468]MDF1610181.1 tripartite tricarboxylate transporter TctB family protein [Hoeflea sp. YIM 152468]